MQAETQDRPGLLLVVHPTGDVVACRRGEGALACQLILDGYEPVGLRGQAAAASIRAEAGV